MTGMNDAAQSRSSNNNMVACTEYAVDNIIIIKFLNRFGVQISNILLNIFLLTIPLLNKLLFSLREPQGALLCQDGVTCKSTTGKHELIEIQGKLTIPSLGTHRTCFRTPLAALLRQGDPAYKIQNENKKAQKVPTINTQLRPKQTTLSMEMPLSFSTARFDENFVCKLLICPRLMSGSCHLDRSSNDKFIDEFLF